MSSLIAIGILVTAIVLAIAFCVAYTRQQNRLREAEVKSGIVLSSEQLAARARKKKQEEAGFLLLMMVVLAIIIGIF